MPTTVTRRRFMGHTLGMIGGTLVAGAFLPLLAEAAARKQILRVAVERDFESLRPDISAGYTNFMLKRLIYTTAILWGTQQRPDGSLTYDLSTIEPLLISTYKVSDDRQQVEFTLREHAKFANGDPLNAPAYKASCAWLFANGGSGGNQYKVNGLASADSIEVVDDVTVRLHLDRPVAWGLYGNALLGTSIVHAGEIMKHATSDDPYGLKWLENKTVESGPFVIESWQKGSMMSLVPNPHALLPSKLERIILQVVPDASTRRIVLERGDVDFAMQIATKDVPDLRHAAGVKVTSFPSTRGWWIGMTWRKAPFNNPHFRRAMAWAMPYDTLLQVVAHGLAERLRSCVPKNISGYAEDFWPYETNLDQARAELAQAQVPDGLTIVVPVSSGDLFEEEATVLIKENLAQLGITLTIQKMPPGQKRTLLTNKQVDMAMYDWRPWTPDAGYFIHWNWLETSFWNCWDYVNPEAQALGRESIVMASGSPDRNATLRRFQEIVNGDIGLIPLFAEYENAITRDNVKGYVSYPDGIPYLAKLSLG